MDQRRGVLLGSVGRVPRAHVESVVNIPWQAVRVFERETIYSVWLFKSTRGRRRTLRRERPTRSSPRFS